VGDLKLYFDIQGLDIDYIGIEPSPGEYECLEKNISPNNAYNFGLWNEDSTLVFYISSHNGDSSYIKPINYTHERQIPTKRLDTFISGHVKLLKIEAEGAEPEVLLGCENLLPEIEYISADLGFERGIRTESTLPFAANFLLERGFELVEIGYPRLTALFHNKAFKNKMLIDRTFNH
jgi:FkbM family methyltransferase